MDYNQTLQIIHELLQAADLLASAIVQYQRKIKLFNSIMSMICAIYSLSEFSNFLS